MPVLSKKVIVQLGFVWVLPVMAFFCTGCQTKTAGNTNSKWAENKVNRAKSKAEKNKPKEKALPSAQAMQIPIGTVHMVDQDGKFVLIRSSRTTDVDPETKIFTYGSDASMSSQLKVSPARKGAYLTADMVDGIPSVGDMVMIVHTISKPSPDQQKKDDGSSLEREVQVLE